MKSTICPVLKLGESPNPIKVSCPSGSKIIFVPDETGDTGILSYAPIMTGVLAPAETLVEPAEPVVTFR